MPEPAHSATARRDSRLIRIRTLSLWMAGGAVAASLGLGTAFAQALPGHARASVSRAAAAGPTAAPPASTPVATPTAPASPGASHPVPAHHRKLAPPAQPPASPPPPPVNPAPPVVSSGGS